MQDIKYVASDCKGYSEQSAFEHIYINEVTGNKDIEIHLGP